MGAAVDRLGGTGRVVRGVAMTAAEGAGPRRIDLRGDPEAPLDEVVRHLADGGIIAYPTETVYGLGGGLSTRAVEAVRALKRRDADKPLIALVGDERDPVLERLAWTPEARELAAIFWPGAVTLVLTDPGGVFPPGVRDSSAGTVGVRVSPHPLVARLLVALGAPITSTSLNEPGGQPARSGSEAFRVVQALGGHDVWVLDAGTLPASGPSTVIDCTGSVPVVLREGTVPLGRLRCAIPEIHERST